MKITRTTPKWAVELVEQVCKDYKRTLPGELGWKNGSNHWSSGRTWYTRDRRKRQILIRKKTGRYVKFKGKIHVTSGTDIKDARLVLLHELAHWIVTKSKGQGHNLKFWKLAFELYGRYDVDLEFALKREKGYRDTAVEGYNYVMKTRGEQ